MHAPRSTLAALLLLGFALPLAAQGSPPAAHEVMRTEDGTIVAIDSATVSHPRDSAFVVNTEVRFPQPLQLESGQRFDREVDMEELDCAAGRTRGLWSTLHLDTALVRRLALSREWTPVADERRALFDARCAWLLSSFATGLPTGYELSAVDEQPELENRGTVATTIAHAFAAALQEGASGTIDVRMRVRADGSVERETIQVVSATEHQSRASVGAAPGNDDGDRAGHGFAAAAIRVAQVMRFRPGRVAGVAVPVWITLPVSYNAH
jgi:hypothetical protein